MQSTPLHFQALVAAVLPLIQSYHEDLTVHDRDAISANPTTPFIHVTRDYGTYLTLLIPAESYPPAGETVPYLFGHADRQHILSQIPCMVEYAEKHHPEASLHYFDGASVRPVTIRQAREILARYDRGIRSAWHATRPGFQNAA